MGCWNRCSEGIINQLINNQKLKSLFKCVRFSLSQIFLHIWEILLSCLWPQFYCQKKGVSGLKFLNVWSSVGHLLLLTFIRTKMMMIMIMIIIIIIIMIMTIISSSSSSINDRDRPCKDSISNETRDINVVHPVE